MIVFIGLETPSTTCRTFIDELNHPIRCLITSTEYV